MIGDTPPPLNLPTICRMVHYYPHVGMGEMRCRAAVVTNIPMPDVDPTVVWLTVFGGRVNHDREKIRHGVQNGQWHWPAECPYPPHGQPGPVTT